MDDYDRYQDQIFPAKLTGRTGTDPIKYSWKELQNAEDGTLVYVTGGRVGTLTNGWAVEADNADVDVTGEPKVWMMLRGMQAGQPVFEFSRYGSGPAAQFARVTSETLDGNGRYPAVLATYDMDTGNWTDTSTNVKLSTLNGEPLFTDNHYAVRYAGLDTVPDPDEQVYLVAPGSVAIYGSSGSISHYLASLVIDSHILVPTTGTVPVTDDTGLRATWNEAARMMTVWLQAAGDGYSGVVTGSGTQYFTGFKTFADGISVDTLTIGISGNVTQFGTITVEGIYSTLVLQSPENIAGNRTQVRLSASGIAIPTQSWSGSAWVNTYSTIYVYDSGTAYGGAWGTISGLVFKAGLYTGGTLSLSSIDGGTW